MTKKASLIYVHIGKHLPEYLYDSVYQSLLINPDIKIYILLDNTLVDRVRNKIKCFNLNDSCYFQVECVPLSILESFDKIEKYSEIAKRLPKDTVLFRDSFWISTTSRFFYIEQFMKLYSISEAFHIENDIMLFESLNNIKSSLNENSLYMVQDHVSRVVPSIIYIPDYKTISKLNDFILEILKTNFMNDMNLLGMYPDKKLFPYTFDNNDSKYIFDGAAIGQFLGGVDPNNLPKESNPVLEKLKMIKNPSKGFINETCDFKIDDSIVFFRKNMIVDNFPKELELIYGQQTINDQINIKQICNLHIHSKQLYQFSSVFNIKYDDIITGDRIISLCDFVISTPGILNYHKNIERYIDMERVILVNDFKKVNIKNLNMYFEELQRNHIKIFIYTHILDDFIKYILDHLSKKIKFTIYLHNSDHVFGETNLHRRLISHSQIKCIYAQNVNYMGDGDKNKITLLPIGLANSMFKHGNVLALYETMSKSYFLKKTRDIYININPSTFNYRATILKELEKNGVETVKSPKPFDEYLKELSEYRFCLCMRGNGIDTHRFFEALYLNVIPVIINNKYTNMQGFVDYLKRLEIPFYEINNDSVEIIVEKYFNTNFFNESLFNKITKYLSKPINNLDQLKLGNYV
jgi:hypothetical protein